MLQKPPLVRQLSPQVIQTKNKEPLIHLSTEASKPNLFLQKRLSKLNLLWCFCSRPARRISAKEAKLRSNKAESNFQPDLDPLESNENHKFIILKVN